MIKMKIKGLALIAILGASFATKATCADDRMLPEQDLQQKKFQLAVERVAAWRPDPSNPVVNNRVAEYWNMSPSECLNFIEESLQAGFNPDTRLRRNRQEDSFRAINIPVSNVIFRCNRGVKFSSLTTLAKLLLIYGATIDDVVRENLDFHLDYALSKRYIEFNSELLDHVRIFVEHDDSLSGESFSELDKRIGHCAGQAEQTKFFEMVARASSPAAREAARQLRLSARQPSSSWWKFW